MDKILHIVVGLLTAAVIAIPCYCISHNIIIGIIASISGVAVGVTKEWCDKIYTGSYDKKDFYATCIGVLIMIIILIIIEVWLNN